MWRNSNDSAVVQKINSLRNYPSSPERVKENLKVITIKLSVVLVTKGIMLSTKPTIQLQRYNIRAVNPYIDGRLSEALAKCRLAGAKISIPCDIASLELQRRFSSRTRLTGARYRWRIASTI